MLTVDDVTNAKTRDDLVPGYTRWLQAMQAGKGVPACASVNHAIIDRWSLAALEYVKRKAWKALDEAPPSPDDSTPRESR
jgi:hypothetical protein